MNPQEAYNSFYKLLKTNEEISNLTLGDIVKFRSNNSELDHGIITTKPYGDAKYYLECCNVYWFNDNKTQFVFTHELKKVV